MDEEWISITEAAERLTKAGDRVTRSSLSRYLAQHTDALRTKREGRSNLVDYVLLRQHRRENVRLAVSEGAAPVETATKPDVKPSGELQGTKVTGSARKALADAEMRELDLAERRKALTPTAEVDRAGRDAVALMRSAFERAVESEAAALSVKYGWDERTIRLALKTFAKKGLDVFHREILSALDGFRRERESEAMGGGEYHHTDEVSGRLQ